MKAGLPPEDLPPLGDPGWGGKPGPYSASPLRDVCGTRISRASLYWYLRRSLLLQGAQKTCAHPEIEAWIAQFGSLDPSSRIVQPPPSKWPISGVIPRLSIWGDKLPFELPVGTYSIDYKYLHSNPRTMPERGNSFGLKERFPEGSKLMLAFFNSRPLVAGLWSLLEFWNHPFVDQFDAVILPDFSSFANDPTPQYLIGERHMQMWGDEGSDAGRVVIPTIAWPTLEALYRQTETWVASYPKINTIHLDCHGAAVNRTGWIWHWLFSMEQVFSCYPNIRWIISGITQGWAIRELNRIFPDRNYSLMPSPSLMIGVLSGGSRDPEWQAREFRRKLAKIEDLRSGREVADASPRPDHWPMFEDVDTSGLTGLGVKEWKLRREESGEKAP